MTPKKQTLSPGKLTAKRFFRSRLAVAGLGILGFLFLFSFLGGLVMPYRQDQVFYREEHQKKPVAAVTVSNQYRITPAPGFESNPVLEAQLHLALSTGETVVSGDGSYQLQPLGRELYGIYREGQLWGIAHKELLQETPSSDFVLLYGALTAKAQGQTHFSAGESNYQLLEDGTLLQGDTPVGLLSRFLMRPVGDGALPEGDFRLLAQQAIQENRDGFSWEGRHFTLTHREGIWSVQEDTVTRVWDAYHFPSLSHPLGTDKNGMDMLTRLMYGGRVSLVIGFAVVLLSGLLGVLLGGISGYFGGFADEAVMRLTDVFYCIPTTPVLIILGAAMDAQRADPRLRLAVMILILGLLGWPDIARLVRGQILSLREQEFMVAAEAAGLSPGRRIFHHLIPNVFPQLIVICTLRLGSAILTEATLSFLGLGVKFPFASWGNIMNDVGNVHVLTSYPFVWIPAGICLVLSVLGFNFVGDGLRDALDPR